MEGGEFDPVQRQYIHTLQPWTVAHLVHVFKREAEITIHIFQESVSINIIGQLIPLLYKFIPTLQYPVKDSRIFLHKLIIQCPVLFLYGNRYLKRNDIDTSYKGIVFLVEEWYLIGVSHQ